MPNHSTDGSGMIIRRLRPLTPVLRAIPQLPVEKRTAFLQIIAARLRLSSRNFFDADLDNAVRAVLWDPGVRPPTRDNPLDKCPNECGRL
jgi:hypothetical protein